MPKRVVNIPGTPVDVMHNNARINTPNAPRPVIFSRNGKATATGAPLIPGSGGGSSSSGVVLTSVAATDVTLTGAVSSAAGVSTEAARGDHVHDITGILVTDNGGTGQNWSATVQGGLPYFSATGVLSVLAKSATTQHALTNGGASNAPRWAQISLTAGVSGVLPEANGGTNQSTYTQGDLLYASAANTLSKLAKSASSTRALMNTGTSNGPAWAQIDLTSTVTGTLPVGNGGTNITTYTQGDVLYSDASNSLAKLAKNTSATRYLSNTGTSNNPAWAQISLTTGVSGILPPANGGTGTDTSASTTSNTLRFDGANWVQTSVLAVSTTIATVTTSAVTNAFSVVGSGNNQLLRVVSNGSDSISARFINSVGSFRIGIPGATNAFVTGTATGDSVLLPEAGTLWFGQGGTGAIMGRWDAAGDLFTTGYLTTAGRRAAQRAVTNANSTLTTADEDVAFSTGNTGRTATMPAATGTGQVFMIWKSDTGTGTITIARAGTDLINGLTTQTITANQFRYAVLTDVASGVWLMAPSGL